MEIVTLLLFLAGMAFHLYRLEGKIDTLIASDLRRSISKE